MRALAAAALKGLSKKKRATEPASSDDGLSTAVKEAFHAMKSGDEKAFAVAFRNAVTLASEE